MSEQREFDISGAKIYLAIPSYQGHVPVETAIALAQLPMLLNQFGCSMSIHAERGNGVITEVRNKLITTFLNSDADYLFWLDDDIVFKPEDLIRVVALCSQKKVVGATYPSRDGSNRFYIHPIDRFGPFEFDEMGLVKCKGLGMGFVCMSREVVEAVCKDKPTYKKTKESSSVLEIFRNGVVDGEYWGEDMNFLYDLYALGYITYVDSDIHLQHVGTKYYDAKFTIKNQGEQ